MISKDNSLWLISISAGRWQTSCIQLATEMGINVLALDADENAPGFKFATLSKIVDIKNEEKVLEAIKSFNITPTGVLSFVSEVGMKSAAIVREKYELPGPNKYLTLLLTNKVSQRRKWQESGVPGPMWVEVTSTNEALKYMDSIGYPCIVKPVDSAGSRGVSKVIHKEELELSIQHAISISTTNSCMIESYMHGTEYAVETFGDGKDIHVLAITEKLKVEGTNGTVARELKTCNDCNRIDLVSSTATQALNALGYQEGPGHTEIIVSDDGRPGLVEAAGRGGGFMVYEKLVKKISGYDIVTQTIRQAIGQTPKNIEVSNRHAILRFFPTRPGIVTKISGFVEASKIDGIEAGAFVTLGQKVGRVKGDGDRLGYILSEGINANGVKLAADYAESLINIEVT